MSESCSVVSDSLRPHGRYSPWNSSVQNTGVGSLSLLQGIIQTQGSNPGLLHCRWILYQLSHKGSLYFPCTPCMLVIFTSRGREEETRKQIGKVYRENDVSEHNRICPCSILFLSPILCPSLHRNIVKTSIREARGVCAA